MCSWHAPFFDQHNVDSCNQKLPACIMTTPNLGRGFIACFPDNGFLMLPAGIYPASDWLRLTTVNESRNLSGRLNSLTSAISTGHNFNLVNNGL